MMSSTIDNISNEIIIPEYYGINIKDMLEYFCEGEDAEYLLQNFDSVQIIELSFDKNSISSSFHSVLLQLLNIILT